MLELDVALEPAVEERPSLTEGFHSTTRVKWMNSPTFAGRSENPTTSAAQRSLVVDKVVAEASWKSVSAALGRRLIWTVSLGVRSQLFSEARTPSITGVSPASISPPVD